MTIKQKGDKLYESFMVAWDHYKKIENTNKASNGFKELLSEPALKTAYQKWQLAVSDYYDFARSVESRDINEEYTSK